MTLEDDVRLVRQEHYQSEDCWYSCPASGDCCRHDAGTECNCGADRANTALDRILARYDALVAEHEAGREVRKVNSEFLVQGNEGSD